ncbi:MAG: GNAT family N-acetyltransferase [Candidatus Omnitrophota bacterium]
MITLEIITDKEIFYSLRKDWNNVLEKSGVNNPYLTHEFLSSWLKAYGFNKELCIVSFKDESSYIGFIPLVGQRINPCLPFKEITFFCNHWGPMDFLLSGNNRLCISLFIDWFKSLKKSEILTLSRISYESQNHSLLLEALRKKQMSFEKINIKNLKISLISNWDDYLMTRSKKFRYEVKSKRKKMSDSGRLCYERKYSFSNLKKDLSDISMVAGSSWKHGKKAGVGQTARGLDFYRNILTEWSDSRNIDLSLLRLNGSLLAYAVRLNYKDKYYAFEASYSKDYHDYSPGMVLQSFLIEDLFKEGRVKSFELGESDSTKARWADESVDEAKFIIYNSELFSKLFHTAKRFFKKCCIKNKISNIKN